MTTIEEIIENIYKYNYVYNESSDSVIITKNVEDCFRKYNIDITDPFELDLFLKELNEATNEVWVKPYVRRILYNTFDIEKPPYFYGHNTFILLNRREDLYKLYKDFKKGFVRYNVLIHHIEHTDALKEAFRLNNRVIRPKHLLYLLNLLYSDISKFEKNPIIRKYLHIIDPKIPYKLKYSKTNIYNRVLKDITKSYWFNESWVTFKNKKPQYEIKTSNKHIYLKVRNNPNSNYIENIGAIIKDSIKKSILLDNYKLVNNYNHDNTVQGFLLKPLNIKHKDRIRNDDDLDFYIVNNEPYYNSTHRNFNKDQKYIGLLKKIKIVPNFEPEKERHILYCMYGTESNILKIGRTMNAPRRFGLYEFPIHASDNHFMQNEQVLLVKYHYSHGFYKKMNNKQTGLSNGTAKFFAAEFILKKLMYYYCNYISNDIEQYHKGLEWFKLKEDITDETKGDIINTCDAMIQYANAITSKASNNHQTSKDVLREINYSEKIIQSFFIN